MATALKNTSICNEKMGTIRLIANMLAEKLGGAVHLHVSDVVFAIDSENEIPDAEIESLRSMCAIVVQELRETALHEMWR